MFQINDKVRIRKVDEYSLAIEVNRKVKNKKTGEVSMKWAFDGYYGNLQGALLGVLSKELFNTTEEKTTLTNIVKKIDAAKKEIIKAINDKINDKAVDDAAKKILKKYTKIFEKQDEKK